MLALMSNVIYLVAFIGIGWAKPRGGSLDPEYEGIGLWRGCKRNPDGEDTTCFTLLGRYPLSGR